MMDFFPDWETIRVLSRAAFIILAFTYAGFMSAKHGSLSIAFIAAAGAAAYAYFGRKPEFLLGASILFSSSFLIRWFWVDIKYWAGRYRNWSKLNPGKDAVVSATVYMVALLSFLW